MSDTFDHWGDALESSYRDEEYHTPRMNFVRSKCRFCGTGGLRWTKDKVMKWVLVDSNNQKHICLKK